MSITVITVALHDPSNFHSHFSSIRTRFIVSLQGIYHCGWRRCRPDVGHVLARLCVARSGYFQNHTVLRKPKRRAEDDEDVIEQVLYLNPVAGRATAWRKTKYRLPEAQAALCYFADAKIQGGNSFGLQLDAEFSI